MRCVCCNAPLNDFESTRKYAVTGDYLDTCNKCIRGLGIETVDRDDLNPTEEVDDYDNYAESFLDEQTIPEDGWDE